MVIKIKVYIPAHIFSPIIFQSVKPSQGTIPKTLTFNSISPNFPFIPMSKWWRSAAGVLRTASETPAVRSYHTIQAVPRELSGHRIAARERAQGRIPAVVFSQKYVQKNPNDPTSVVASSYVSQKLLLTTELKQIKAILKSIELPFFCSTAFPLQIRAGAGSSTILQNGKVLPVKVRTCFLYIFFIE